MQKSYAENKLQGKEKGGQSDATGGHILIKKEYSSLNCCRGLAYIRFGYSCRCSVDSLSRNSALAGRCPLVHVQSGGLWGDTLNLFRRGSKKFESIHSHLTGSACVNS